MQLAVDCRSDVCSMWKGLSDTEWLNRAMGNQGLAVMPSTETGAARYRVKTRLSGFAVTWEERPFEFEFMKYLRIRRDMASGPITRLEITYTTSPMGLACRVDVQLRLWPSYSLLTPVVKVSGRASLSRLVKAVERLDVGLVDKGTPPDLAPARPVNRERIDRAGVSLRQTVSPTLAERLIDVVVNGPDDLVVRLRPYVLAERWGLPRSEVLAGCLEAVKAGLLQLRWDVVCPSCRTGASTVDSLTELASHGSCQLCELQFGLTFDELVEATFRPVEAIRVVDSGPYCVGSLSRMPHVVSQAVVAPGQSAEIGVPAEEGLFRLFVRGGQAGAVRAIAGAPPRVEVSQTAWPATLQVAPGGSVAISTSSSERHVKLERATWANVAATARDVMVLPSFRRDFSAQVLRPGLSLSVQRVALVFSDLTGSTDLYAQAGDAEAFRVVLNHFDVLQKAIERHGGSVVKTIGDAVMATFPDEVAAALGALEMLRSFESLRQQDAVAGRTSLKVGAFAGPGFVATANNIIDYFGQTVNIAARLQGEAKPGQLVLTEATALELLRSGHIAESQVVERYDAKLKGVDGALRVARLQVTHDTRRVANVA